MKCQNCGKEASHYGDVTWLLCDDCAFKKCKPQLADQPKQLVVKADNGKPRLDLVPLEVLYPLAKVREYGLSKYGKSGMENWDKIEDERYLAALLRHLVAYQKDNNALDEESGLPAIYHVLCNATFLAIKHARKEQQEDK